MGATEVLEGKALLDGGHTIHSGKAGKYLTFRLAEEDYGLEILKVKEILGLMSITQIPCTPEYIRGVINLRSKVIPVMDLRVKFGMDTIADTNETCIIVGDVSSAEGSVLIGVLVDNVSEVLDIAAGDIENAPSFGTNVNTEFILGMGMTKDRVTMLLDIDKVLTFEELEMIESTAKA